MGSYYNFYKQRQSLFIRYADSTSVPTKKPLIASYATRSLENLRACNLASAFSNYIPFPRFT